MASFKRSDMPSLVLLAIISASAVVPVNAQNFSVLWNFGARVGDPANPSLGTVVQGRNGFLYSTSPYGESTVKVRYS